MSGSDENIAITVLRSFQYVKINTDQLPITPGDAIIDATQFHLNFETKLTGDALHHAGERDIINLKNPFVPADSIPSSHRNCR